MTDKEKAIVMAHTGICMLTGEKYGVFHKYIEDILGRPVYTHELAIQSISDEIKEKSRDDFIKLCMEEQEPCSDAISRQAEKKELVELEDGQSFYCISPEDIETLPPVTAQHWIPVSERLPEDRREVLVTAYWHETYQVMMASYYGDGLWWCVPFNNCGEHMQRLNPKAWMPLPESYEPQERSDEE